MTDRRKAYVLAGAALAVLLAVGTGVYYYNNNMTMSSGQAHGAPNPQDSSMLASDFRVLSQAHTDVCAYLGSQQANTNYIGSLPDGYLLQGSCCSPMDYGHYMSQVTSLKNYSSILVIPPDPYNVSAILAKQMISYDTMALTPAQQAAYDGAMQMSKEGPCCCQCWAWYAHEGLAKALISQHGWNAQQIANLWHLEDCCGGA